MAQPKLRSAESAVPSASPFTQPLQFHPFLRPMVWGGRRLGDILHKTLPTNLAYGESWELSDHPLHQSVVAQGIWHGHTLRELLKSHPEEILGLGHDGRQIFPWLIKFLDCHDWLSVQVHPDELAVRTLWPGEGSKTEAWFVIDAPPGSRIYAGLQPGVDEKALRSSLARGNVVDCIASFEPQPGDCVFLPAGTVHAVGGGVLMAEIQQTSDATFRLFDWNRSDAEGNMRPLHIEESMAAIHWDQGPVEPIRVREFGGVGLNSGQRKNLVDCSCFLLDYLPAGPAHELGGVDAVQVLVVLKGTGTIGGRHEHVSIGTGQTWLLPARMPAATLRTSEDFAGLLTSQRNRCQS